MYLRYFGNMAVLAVLLYWDVRVALFYFMAVALSRFEIIRALVRVKAVRQELLLELIALEMKVDISDEARVERMAVIRKAAGEKDWEDYGRDAWLVGYR